MNLKTAYAAGVLTAPVWYFMFRRPINRYILVPILADETLNEPLYNLMMVRNEVIDRKKKQEGET